MQAFFTLRIVSPVWNQLFIPQSGEHVAHPSLASSLSWRQGKGEDTSAHMVVEQPFHPLFIFFCHHVIFFLFLLLYTSFPENQLPQKKKFFYFFQKNLCKGNKKHHKTKNFELSLPENPAKTWNIKNKIVYLWQKWKDNENDKRLYYHTANT